MKVSGVRKSFDEHSYKPRCYAFIIPLAVAQCIVIGPVCGFVCLCVCVFACLFVGLFVCLWVCYHDNSKLRASILTKLGL